MGTLTGELLITESFKIFCLNYWRSFNSTLALCCIILSYCYYIMTDFLANYSCKDKPSNINLFSTSDFLAGGVGGTTLGLMTDESYRWDLSSSWTESDENSSSTVGLIIALYVIGMSLRLSFAEFNEALSL
jgi:hypothetical protein